MEIARLGPPTWSDSAAQLDRILRDALRRYREDSPCPSPSVQSDPRLRRGPATLAAMARSSISSVSSCGSIRETPAATNIGSPNTSRRASGAFRPDEVSLIDTGDGHAYVLATFGAARTLVNVHIDTVPAGSGWSRDPHAPLVKDDCVYGLGAADTKGAIAAVLTALSYDRPRDLAILFSGDEERGNTTMRTFLDHPIVAGLTHAVVCEPTLLRVGTRHRGILACSATLHGEGGHSSRADTLPRPIAELARLATRIDDWGRPISWPAALPAFRACASTLPSCVAAWPSTSCRLPRSSSGRRDRRPEWTSPA